MDYNHNRVIWIKVTECLIVAQSAIRRGSGWERCFPICLIWSFWTTASFFINAMGENFTHFFDFPFWGTCWQWLTRTADRALEGHNPLLLWT
jgi:hypothetical protein